MSSPDQELDPDQEAAARSDDVHIAVLAGPGSGKTRTLCARAAHLAQADTAEHLLLLTFANRAAAEIKARALNFSAIDRTRLFAGTYHAFCVSVLRDHGAYFGIPSGFEILDEDETSLLAAEVAASLGVFDGREMWGAARRLCEPPAASIESFVTTFEAEKRRLGVVDFEDLLVFTKRLFDEYPEMPAVYAARYRHLLIDEFQDTNPLQLAIVFQLAAHTKTVSIFADDDQAVLSFTGAAAEHVYTAVDHLGATVFSLQRNYRCRRVVADVANSLMAADPRNSGRQMEPMEPGGEVRLLVHADEAAETETIVAEILRLRAEGVELHEVAILGRYRKRLVGLLGALREADVPVVDWLGPTHAVAVRRVLRRVLAIVLGALTDRQAQGLFELAEIEDGGHREPDALLDALPDEELRATLREVRRKAISGGSASEVVSAAASAVKMLEPDLAGGVEEIAAELDYVEQIDPSFSIDHLLSDLALGSRMRVPETARGVALAMLQGTKGLEWNRVYLVGMEEGVLPFFRCTSADEIREERRICFVGVCRAKSELTLSRCRSRGSYPQRPSRFLREMGLEPDG